MLHSLGEEASLKCIIVSNESLRLEAAAILHSAMIHVFISQCANGTTHTSPTRRTKSAPLGFTDTAKYPFLH